MRFANPGNPGKIMGMKTIQAYIQSEPKDVQRMLKKMHAILRRAVPRAGEKLAWGMPTLTLGGNLLHFAAFKNHMSLFPGTAVVKQFQPRLKRYVTTKAAIQFPYGAELPAGLITAIAKVCVRRDLAKAGAKAKKVKARAAKKAKKKSTKKKSVRKKSAKSANRK